MAQSQSAQDVRGVADKASEDPSFDRGEIGQIFSLAVTEVLGAHVERKAFAENPYWRKSHSECFPARKY